MPAGICRVRVPNGLVVGERVVCHMDVPDSSLSLISLLSSESWFVFVPTDTLAETYARHTVFVMGAPTLRWARITRGALAGMTVRVIRHTLPRGDDDRVRGRLFTTLAPWEGLLRDLTPVEPEGWAYLAQGYSEGGEGVRVLVLFNAGGGFAECATFSAYNSVSGVIRVQYQHLNFGPPDFEEDVSNGRRIPTSGVVSEMPGGEPVHGHQLHVVKEDGRLVKPLLRYRGWILVEDAEGQRWWATWDMLRPRDLDVAPVAFSRLGSGDVWEE